MRANYGSPWFANDQAGPKRSMSRSVPKVHSGAITVLSDMCLAAIAAVSTNAVRPPLQYSSFRVHLRVKVKHISGQAATPREPRRSQCPRIPYGPRGQRSPWVCYFWLGRCTYLCARQTTGGGIASLEIGSRIAIKMAPIRSSKFFPMKS